jgi:hypothetical protein
MKKLKVAAVALVVPLLVGAFFKFRSEPLTSADALTSTANPDKKPDSKPDASANQNLSQAVPNPTAVAPGKSAATAEDKISHQDLVAEYEALNDADLKATIAAIDKEMEDKRLIDKANRGEITAEEREELGLLLKKFSALKEVETLRLLASDS